MSKITRPQSETDNRGESVVNLVIKDLEDRRQFGIEKYGDELRVYNSKRDSLVDAYQEALDLCIYLRQSIAQASEVVVKKE